VASPERTGTEWNRSQKYKRTIISRKEEIRCKKLSGGTVFEIETSCGGTEALYDKMVRLIRSETITDADKDHKARYNKDSNLFVGRSLQEE